jgi:hypothetical protein
MRYLWLGLQRRGFQVERLFSGITLLVRGPFVFGICLVSFRYFFGGELRVIYVYQKITTNHMHSTPVLVLRNQLLILPLSGFVNEWFLSTRILR